MQELHRCRWVNLTNPAYVRYHDLEWGRPHYDDAYLFELLLLEKIPGALPRIAAGKAKIDRIGAVLDRCPQRIHRAGGG